jgi:hypothetical protein
MNEATFVRQASATPGSAKNMRMSSTHGPKVAAAAAPDLKSSKLRTASPLAKSKPKSQEVFDESGIAIPFDRKLPIPNSFSAQLLPGNLMQLPDGKVMKKRHSMYA